jgi:hypothetical protein
MDNPKRQQTQQEFRAAMFNNADHSERMVLHYKVAVILDGYLTETVLIIACPHDAAYTSAADVMPTISF